MWFNEGRGEPVRRLLFLLSLCGYLMLQNDNIKPSSVDHAELMGK